MTDEKRTASFVLTENDIDIIHELAGMYGLSYSDAARMIIREWALSDRGKDVARAIRKLKKETINDR